MDTDRKQDYVDRVTRGEGWVPWQSREPDPREEEFRAGIERRKQAMLDKARRPPRPALISEAQFEQVQRNLRTAAWARDWCTGIQATAERLLALSAAAVSDRLSPLTPWVGYTFFCPNCYGRRSFAGAEYTIIEWDHRSPDRIRCRVCGHEYPSAQYPETTVLHCPRRGQTLTFYSNDDERAHPEDHGGRRAWQWAGRPVHPCFSGIVREYQAMDMIHGARALALTYRLTGNRACAERCLAILERYAHCFRYHWLYHDYWDTVADCDPLFAAWHDKALPLEWKRLLFADGYADDTLERAAMRQAYWGAGRLHPSTGAIAILPEMCEAFDLIVDARTANGTALVDDATYGRLARDLFLEWVIEAEPFAGIHGEQLAVHNKAPRLYHAMAAVSRLLGIAEYARHAFQGFMAVFDRSFGHDGFSKETPSYTDMYLGQLLPIAERLEGMDSRLLHGGSRLRGKPGHFSAYKYEDVRRVMRTRLEQLRPDGRVLTHGDSHQSEVADPRGSAILEIGLRRFPADYAARLPALYAHRGSAPTEYAVFNLDSAQLAPPPPENRDLQLPELFFPAWMVGILRHGRGMSGTILTLSLSPPGGHRHYDNLALYYETAQGIVLGDHGYLAEAPAQRWCKDTLSHNLVVVDDQTQVLQSGGPRQPALGLMVTAPWLSAVEGRSDCYPQCREYCRRLVLLKGPGGDTIAIDLFRVAGGKTHAYRVFSEIASSDAGTAGDLEFTGVDLTPQGPLPNYGASEAEDVIFGLRDVREAVPAPRRPWTALWREPGRSYRLWMLSDVQACHSAHAHGQEKWADASQVGRRVRYVEAVRRGQRLASTFVAVHEPSRADGSLPVTAAERLRVPAAAGRGAVALRLQTAWGDYTVLHDFDHPATVDGIRFHGCLAVLWQPPGERARLLTVGAQTFVGAGFAFENQPHLWTSPVETWEDNYIGATEPRPDDWPESPEGVRNWVLTTSPPLTVWTGYPVTRTEPQRVLVRDFRPASVTEFRLWAVRHLTGR